MLTSDLGAEADFELLFDFKFAKMMQRGYSKGGEKLVSADRKGFVERHSEHHQFFLIPRVQRLVFLKLWEREPPKSPRKIIDHFFASLFNAWLDYQGRLDEKRWIVAFAPRLAYDTNDAASFFDCYPDGRVIQIIRDPQTWFASAKWHRKSVVDGKSQDELIGMWLASAESMLGNKRRYGDRVIILTFEDLVGRTETTMRRLSRDLRIEYDSVLLEPTFNGRAMSANSSFAVEKTGVIATPLTRETALSDTERRMVEVRCCAVYESVLATAANLAA